MIAPILPSTIAAQTPQTVQAAPAPIREIQPGQTITSSIPTTGPTNPDGIHYEDYALTLAPNDSVRIEMDAGTESGFDTFLELREAGSDTALVVDDDSGEGLNSRLTFTAPAATGAASLFVIRARPLGITNDDQRLPYTLRVTRVASPPPPADFAGPQVTGTLDQNSPEEASYEPQHYAAYWVQATAGERLLFEMTSSSSAPTLMLTGEAGGLLAGNSGFGSQTVRLIVAIPETGRYQLRALVPASETANFTVYLTRSTEPAYVAPRLVRVGEAPVTGALGPASYASMQGGSSAQIEYFYQLYDLRVRRGQPVTVLVRAEGFDPQLEAGITSPLSFQPALADSDNQAGTARITIRPFGDGIVTLRVRTQSVEAGTYQLSVVSGEAPSPAPAPAPEPAPSPTP